MKDLKYFIQKNYVFVSSLLSAIVLMLQQAMLNTAGFDWPAVAYAGFVILAGSIANEFKGRGITLAGIIGTVANAFITVNNTGKFTWDQFILSALIAILTAYVTSLKPQVHER